MSCPYVADQTALVVMDLQPSILARLPDDATRARVLSHNAALIRAARAAHIVVVFVNVAFTQAEFDALPQRNKAFSAFSKMRGTAIEQLGLEPSQPSAQPHADLNASPHDVYIRKCRSCPFTTTDLHAQLRQRNITYLIFTGVATSNCVLAATRHAENRDYGITVVEDACADTEADVHAFAVQRLLSKQADIQSTQATIERMSSVAA